MSGFYIAAAALGALVVWYTIVRPAIVPSRIIEPWERALSVFLMAGGIFLDVFAAIHL